jgi:hypothetical protein
MPVVWMFLLWILSVGRVRSFVWRNPTECVCVCVCVCVSVSVIRCNMNAQHLKWVVRRGRTKREGRDPVTKIRPMTPKLHTAHCSYNTCSVRCLTLQCHKSTKFRNFNFDTKCAAKTGFGISSYENLTKSTCSVHYKDVAQRRNV